jgi:hypothetical protein
LLMPILISAILKPFDNKQKPSKTSHVVVLSPQATLAQHPARQQVPEHIVKVKSTLRPLDYS